MIAFDVTHICWVGFHHAGKALFELLERGIVRDEEPDGNNRLIRVSRNEFDLDSTMLGNGQGHCEVHELKSQPRPLLVDRLVELTGSRVIDSYDISNGKNSFDRARTDLATLWTDEGAL